MLFFLPVVPKTRLLYSMFILSNKAQLHKAEYRELIYVRLILTGVKSYISPPPFLSYIQKSIYTAGLFLFCLSFPYVESK